MKCQKEINQLKIRIMKTKIEALEKNLSKVAGVNVEITFARTNMVTLAWDGEDIEVFNRLQKYFKGVLFEYEYDEECDMSVCCLSI
nr:MAG TPA_asm: hypothetical protein [Caudoviricetes sp.]